MFLEVLAALSGCNPVVVVLTMRFLPAACRMSVAARPSPRHGVVPSRSAGHGRTPSVVGWKRRGRHPGALRTDIETGPKRSGIGGERTVEQRSGRGTT